jgi:hypothetical protein
MKYYILLALAFIEIAESYLNVPLLNLRKNKTTSLSLSKKNIMDNNQKFIYKNYLLSVRKVKRSMLYSNSAVDINGIIDSILSNMNTNTTTNNEAVIYLKKNETLIDNSELVAKNLVLSNIYIDVSNIKQIHISTKNDTLIVNLDKNNIQNNDMVRYELGKIDALLNVASIITSLMNN